ncbi:MAG: DUF2177 family protein [Epsilonproteobacteria bacterium]|nr:DUF2177 family protein [Campylobacterota bacterium]
MRMTFLYAGIRFLALCCVAATVELVWIGVVASDFYKTNYGPLMRPATQMGALHWFAAVAVWVLVVSGQLVFLLPYLKRCSWITSCMYGLFWGLITYGIYACTNFAVMAHSNISLLTVDIVWGCMFNLGLALLIKYLY